MGKIYVNDKILKKGITKEELIDLSIRDSKGKIQTLQRIFGYAGSSKIEINGTKIKIGRVADKKQEDIYIDFLDNTKDDEFISIYTEKTKKEVVKNE